jgi:hypothetical protein
MQPVSKQRIGKHASTIIKLLFVTVFSIQSVQSGYKEENWGNQFSWALQGRLGRDGDPVRLRVECPAVKKRVSCKSAAVKEDFICGVVTVRLL